MSATPLNNSPAVGELTDGLAVNGASGRTVGALYGLTIFVSAFLLFEVEPIIAKIILPWFGGSAAVWTTCLLFFQVALLLGYAYANWIVRSFSPRVQTRLHIVLLAASLLVLPILPHDTWKPVDSAGPIGHILMLLAATIGLPYFLLSATSPLLQAWYARAHSGAQPYRLFALSNAASMLALLSYPVLVEPLVSTRHQALGWSMAFAGFAVLCAVLALRSGNASAAREAAPSTPRPSAVDQILWVALAACGSILLLAITNQLSQNVAAIPFLWILPLSLYLLTFILCFEGGRWYWRALYLRFMAVALAGMAYALSSKFFGMSLAVQIPLFAVGLFLCCMVCHGELARLKPAPDYLTSFYLMIALGGALGGLFVAVVAPLVFSGFFELPIGMAACAVLVLIVLRRDSSSMFYRARWQPTWLILITLCAILMEFMVYQIHEVREESLLMARNFYGTLRVMDDVTNDPDEAARQLMNGTITHGKEYLSPERRDLPTTYYGANSGVGLALQVMGRRHPVRAGFIGLGAGTLAAYGRAGDHFTFYDINPLVIQLAHSEFYFLKDSKAQIDIVPGDARLSLERQPRQNFDVLAVDAFTGDAIPIHLLTREAFVLYFNQLKPGGVLAVHVSNRYLDLKPVVQQLAESLGKRAMVIHNSENRKAMVFNAHWVLVSDNQDFFEESEIKNAATAIPARPDMRMWTDDYSSLWEVLK